MSREWIIAAIIAVLFHVALLFGFRLETAAVPLPVSDTAVDVSLVAAEPAPAAATAAPEPPPAEPVPPPPPVPTPETPPPTPVPEPAQVAPPTPAPVERPVHHLPPRPAHPNPLASKAVGPVQEGQNTGLSAGASGAGSSPIRPRSNPKPPYPPEAQRLHQQGRVLLEVQVGADGRAISVSVKRSSGFPILDNAAVQTVERWTFEPARVAGLPVTGRADVPVNFSLAQ